MKKQTSPPNEALIESLFEKLEEKVSTYNAIPTKVREHLEMLGLNATPMAVEPEPRLPDNVASESLAALNVLYDKFTRYYDYISRKLSEAESYRDTAKRLVKLVESVLYFKYKNDSRFTSAQERENAMQLDWQFIKADVQLGQFDGITNALTRVLSNTGQSRDRVFREIRRRTENSFGRPGGSLIHKDQ